MTEPKIVKKQSKTVNLDPGVYYFCNCGLSKDGVFCDGNHKGTSFSPKKFMIEEPRSVSLCLCKHTQKSPFCDGTHRKL